MKARNIIIFLLILFILELVFKSSGLINLASLELLIIAVVIIEETWGRDFWIYFIFLLLTMVLEVLNFELIAMRGFILSLVYLLVINLGGAIKLIKSNKDLRMLLIVGLTILSINIFRTYDQLGVIQIDLLIFISNLIIYILIYKIINKLAPSKYVI